jgi:hypothetical protein
MISKVGKYFVTAATSLGVVRVWLTKEPNIQNIRNVVSGVNIKIKK